MLGEAFHRQFSTDYSLRVTDIDLNAPWISFLDFRDEEAYRRDVMTFAPDYLFHLGAHTSLEYCEENPEDAYLTNSTSVEHAVRISNELRIPLLYISTAGIFDGRKETYNDWDIPNPSGHYARSKYMGERFVLDNKSDALVCRAGWMMGGGPGKDKKFVGRIMDQLRSGRRKLNVVNDKAGTPTYTVDFADNVKSLIEKEVYGLFNMACSGETTRVEVAAAMLRLLGLQDRVELSEVSSGFFEQIYFAPRPDSERLINAKLEQRGLNKMRNWKICLGEYLTTYYRDYLPLQQEEAPAYVVQTPAD